MKQTLNVLIIEDHPVIIDSFKTALTYIENNSKNVSFKIDVASNCKTAYSKIENVVLSGSIDLIFLDISLPPDMDNKLYSGEQLGVKVREKLPNAQILVCTAYSDELRLNSILTTINPQGFLIKSDVGFSDLIVAIEKLISNQVYYSQTVVNLFRKKATNKISFDDIDVKLLYEISNGSKMKELLELLPLTKSGINKRKNSIKEKFGIVGQSDRAMILIAKDKSFI